MQKLNIGTLALVGEEEEGEGLVRLSLRLSESFIFKGWRDAGLLVFDEKLSTVLPDSVWSLVPSEGLPLQISFFIERTVLIIYPRANPAPGCPEMGTGKVIACSLSLIS